MTDSLDKLTIKGFRSIQSLVDFPLKRINVLIGGNGAGKSNLISFFRMLRAMMDGQLKKYLRDGGGISDFLFNGRKITEKMKFEMHFGARGYRFTIESGPQEALFLTQEARYYRHGRTGWWELGDSLEGRSRLVEEAESKKPDSEFSKFVYDAISSWQIYHFHDTSATAKMRGYEIVQDKEALRFDAANIAPYLLHLRKRHETDYRKIIEVVRLVTPFFDDFILKPEEFGEQEKVDLSWRQKESDYPLHPLHFSDGTLRFICLATALLQPDPPSTIIIDEPELGLHPYATDVLAELVKASATHTQILLSTQSPPLVDCFTPEDIVVVKRADGASIFCRLKKADLDNWLNEYALGELWRKNVIAGGPSHE